MAMQSLLNQVCIAFLFLFLLLFLLLESKCSAFVLTTCTLRTSRSALFAKFQELEEKPQSYTKEPIDFHLLNASEEIVLARQYQLGAQIEAQSEIMKQQFGRAATVKELATAFGLTPELVVSLTLDGRAAKNIIIKANMKLVYYIAKLFRFRGVEYDDLISDGLNGLVNAVERYDPRKGFRLSTYAVWWIRQAISRCVAMNSRPLEVPVGVYNLLARRERVKRSFIAVNGRAPSVEEYSKLMNIPQAKVEILNDLSIPVRNIDESIFKNKLKNDKKRTFGQVVSDDFDMRATTFQTFNSHNFLSIIKDAGLTERENLVLNLRNGISGDKLSLNALGEYLNITRERVRQIELRALSKIKIKSKNR